MRRTRMTAATAVVTTLITAGCGSDDNADRTPPDRPAVSTTAPSASPAPTMNPGPGTFTYRADNNASVTLEVPVPRFDQVVTQLTKFANAAGGEFANPLIAKATLDNRSNESVSLSGFRIVTADRSQIDLQTTVKFGNQVDTGDDTPGSRAYTQFYDILNGINEKYPLELSPGVRGTAYFVAVGVRPAQVARVLAPTDLGPTTDFVDMKRS